MADNNHFREQMPGIEAMVFFFFIGVDQSSTQIQGHSSQIQSQGNGSILGSPTAFRAPLWHHLFQCFMDWGDTIQTNQWISWQWRILRKKEGHGRAPFDVSLLLICLPLISTPALAKLAGTQAPFRKTMKHKRLLSLCFESTGFSSDWVAANYPPCNYGDPRSKQMGKSFVFKWRRNQYVGRKGSLFIWTDSRWLVAKRQRAGEPGLALDQSGCPQTRGTTETTGLCLPSSCLSAVGQLGRESGGQGRDSPQKPVQVRLPTLTPLEHQVLLFCCCSTATCWFLLSGKKKFKERCARAQAIWQTSLDGFDRLELHTP